MLKFQEESLRQSVNSALALRHQINPFLDAIFEKGITNICFLGIGGTYASAMQTVSHMKEFTSMEVFAENAAEYITTGNRRIMDGTLLIYSSVTGSTPEIVKAVEKAHAAHATILAFLDNPNPHLRELCELCISYPQNEQLKLFMAADRILFLRHEFDCYDDCYENFDCYLADALISVEQSSDSFAQEFAKKHCNDTLHYFVGAGNQWGSTYSYGMCYWEEMHWMATKTVSSGEFFHGTLEIISRDTPVTLFISEDASRPLSLRVAAFLPKICANYTIIDAADYPLIGIKPQYRGFISHLVTHAVTNRIDVHLEAINCHPMEIRRYYRCLEY